MLSLYRPSHRKSLSSISKQAASILLVLCLFCSSTPAAAQTTITLAQSSSVSLWFWFHSSGLAKLVQSLGSGKIREQEKQRDRDEKISRIQIFPADVSVDIAEHVRFVVVAYDVNGNSVGGVKVKWSGESTQPGRRVRVSKDGDFEATAPGSFTIVAQAVGKTAQVNVTVRPGLKPNLSAPPTGTREVSTRDLPGNAVGSNGTTKTQKRTEGSNRIKSSVALNAKRSHVVRRVNASVPKPMMLSDGWDSSNYWSADDPGNEVGDPPGRPPDSGAGSGNFQFTARLLSLAGRGLNISLAVSYNSRLWNKAGSQISYDNDRGWPAPGFSLGFGKMLGMGVYNGCMLVDGDGTRHSYSGSITFYSWGTIGVMHTTDGSFIDYTYQTGTGGIIIWAQAKLPNGMVINYGANGPGGVFPTSIEDANGNLIYITYVNNSGPCIQTVTDTAGRVINFHYNYNNLLTAITAPGLSGDTRTLVRLHYHQHTLSYGFSGLTASVRDYYPWVVDAIYYPGTSTGYWLNDSDSYSSYGMLAKVVEERSLGFSASSLTDMGSVWQGSVTRTETYNYPLTPNYSLTDAPTYTTRIESWSRDGTNFDSATTTYEVHENDTPRMTIITLPNSTKNKQLSFNAPGQFNDGLIYRDETYVTESQPLQISKSFWDPGAYGSARPTRVEKTDERGQTTATEFSYGSVYNQVTEVRDYDYGGTSLVRATRTTYQNSTNYTGSCNSYGCYGRHIFNLPLSNEIYASDNVTRVSRTDYQYDGQPLSATPNVVMHDPAANPHAEEEGFCYWDIDWNDPDCTGNCWDYNYNCDGYCNQIWICPYDSSTDYRGNVTQITSYADAAGLTGAVTETRRYDVTGNIVKTSSSCCEQTTFNYTIDTQYAYAQSKTRGSATDAYAQVTTSATYDFNTGAGLSATDANGRQSTASYDANTLRSTSGVSPTGAHTDYAYDDGAMSITATTYLAAAEGGGVAAQNVKYLNGHGQVRQEKALGAGGVWDFVDTVYDTMGQVSQQTLPSRSGETQQWSTSTYDAIGRVTTVTAPDGSVTQTLYNEATRPSVASTTPGETMRVQDAWGRERWARMDARNLLVEVVEPDPGSSGSVQNNGMVTTYTYNMLGKLTQITQASQTRSFKHDSLGRLTAQKLAEANATLNDAGTYVGSGSWTDVFTYDERSNLTSRTDARGVKTVYTYNNDPLNRLQSISWDTSGFGDSANPIVAAATVSYSYRVKSYGSQLLDVTQPSSITASGVSTESYGYDTEGRISSKTFTLTSRPSYPFVTDHIYDSLDRAKDVRYPAEYGNGSAPRKLVHRDYAIAGRLAGVTFDGQSQASNIAYNAAGQTTLLSVGTGTNQVNESYSYNTQTGLVAGQTAVRNGTTLLNLSYDYAGTNGKRTGQLVKISNNLDHNKDRGYEYDALGRLQRATGGQNVIWAQRYFYDRYGNRNNVYSNTADQYIRNFYQSALARQPNSSELQSWLSTLQSAYTQGSSQFWSAMQSLGGSIFTSQEYINRNRSDHDYVYDLYRAYLLRDPDPGGWAFWEAGCAQNGRNAVRAGFDWSLEFNLKVSGTSPYSPPGGATVPRDGWEGIWYDNANNHVAVPGWNYDVAGNQTRVQNGAGWQRFQYDAANRLVKVKADDNVTVLATYTYGDSSDRLIMEQGGVRTYYVFEDDSTIAEYSESGGSTTPTWSKSYVYLGLRLLSTLTPNGSGGESVEYHHPDRLGTRLVTNPSTGSFFEQVTLPFGTALTAESTGATNRRFTSYDRSATTGLDYALNRHYDPQQGRFTQVDPAGMRATVLVNPQSLNLYTYCTNDPVNRIDPDGLGLISFFKKAFNWIKKHWKIVLVAVAAAVAVLLIPGAPAFLSSFFQDTGQIILSGAGVGTEGGGGLGTTLKIILGASFAAAIAGLGILSQKVESFEDKRLRDAKDELLRRLEANKGDNPCAKLFGGLKEAKKKLKETQFKRAATVNPAAFAETQGKTVTLNPNNGFYDTSGLQTLTVGLLGSGGRFIPLQITLNNTQFAAFVLLHELGHRTGTLRPDGNDPFGFISIFNSGDVQRACFPEAKPVLVP
jgi:RHS repeat-associated protein